MAYDPNWLFIDAFAGGGGASTGIAQAIGRDVDIAINHSPTAIAIHKANHPTTDHHCQDIRAVWPAVATRLRPVAGAWFSPDCKEYSKAKGAPVKDRHIRALSNEATVWLKETRPLVAWLENVEEYEYAAPLDAAGVPIKGLEGQEFQRLVRQWRRLGYKVEWRRLRACDYGAPTSRLRLYVVMRRDGEPIVWPEPTHGPPDSPEVLTGKRLPYRTAAECIDWSIPCPSIFLTKDEVRAQKLRIKRPLEDASLRRVAHGVMRHVVEAAKAGKAFVLPVTHQGDVRTHSLREPARTVTAAHRGELALSRVALAPHITKFHSGSVGAPMGREMPTVTANGQPARPAGAVPLGRVDAVLAPVITHGQHGGASHPAGRPHHTIAASTKDTNGVIGATLVGVGGRRGQSPPMAIGGSYPTTTAKADTAVATATLAEAGFIDRQFGGSAGNPAVQPIGATTAGGGGKSAAVTAFLSSFYTSNTNGGRGRPDKPLKTAMAGGNHHAVVCAHIEQANGGPRNRRAAGRKATQPLSTATTKGSQQRIVQTTLIEEGDLSPEMMAGAVQVAAFLIKYYGNESGGHGLDRPLDTVTTKDRFAVVTVTIDATTYVIVDIGLRMLTPRELANAQGFPPTYKLDPIVRKYLRGKWVERPLTIAEQISAIGNSVCPPVARALVAANRPRVEMRMAA